MVMEMVKKQEQEWKIAQDINFSIDIVSATKQHLHFLAVIDRLGLFSEDGPALQRAIHRYNECWIPLLAKHTESPLFEGALVVPVDCEWIWHCHRLNPVTYNSDCQSMYGMILDNKNVVSSTQGASVQQTKDVWKKLYPNEPFALDLNVVALENIEEKVTEAGKFTQYDLIASSQRQSLFYSEISGAHMDTDVYLEKAVARYKGFLHLIKRNMENDIDDFLAPTFDIDLIWHTHQLYPVSYCNDMVTLVEMILGHDDTVTDRTKGAKLDVGFTMTVNNWSHMYGSSMCDNTWDSEANALAVAEIKPSRCGKPGESDKASAYDCVQTKPSPCGKPWETQPTPCGKSGESKVSACVCVQTKPSPCGKPGETKVNACIFAQNMPSPCGKPGQSNKDSGSIFAQTKPSPCGKPGESNMVNACIIVQTKSSPCGKPKESKVSACLPVQSKPSPCGKPRESKASACLPVQTRPSPCGKPGESKANACVWVQTKPSPCGKPKESNKVWVQTKPSPCGKPRESTASIYGYIQTKSSPCGKPKESNKASACVCVQIKPSPHGKSKESNKASACVCIQTKPSPCGKPKECNKASACVCIQTKLIPCGNPGKNNSNACIVSHSEANPCGIPWESNTNDCLVHRSIACSDGISCA